MLKQSLGIIETNSLSSAVEIAHLMEEKFDVSISNVRKLLNGYTTVFIKGELGAVQDAIDYGAGYCNERNSLVAKSIIAVPHKDLFEFIEGAKNE